MKKKAALDEDQPMTLIEEIAELLLESLDSPEPDEPETPKTPTRKKLVVASKTVAKKAKGAKK